MHDRIKINIKQFNGKTLEFRTPEEFDLVEMIHQNL